MRTPLVGALKSPPTITPSREWNTRDARTPLANQASRRS
jgi:hypothetical protein